ncbi:MAG: hypothetical protein OJJ55_14995, partial [Rhodococcus sp.]|nr:hypothetical protein [Rhodococcus sp. (in: high G+C Gram-positive bacteria)]
RVKLPVPLPHTLHHVAFLWPKRDVSFAGISAGIVAAHRIPGSHGAPMQFKLEHADPHADPHDAIVAQLRDMAPRLAHDLSEFDITPAAAPKSPSEPLLHDTPLNDNVGDIRSLKPRGRTGRGIMLIVCAGVAAAAAWHSYGEEAKQKLSHLASPLLGDASAPTQSANASDPQDTAPQTAEPQSAANPPAQAAATAAPATPAEPPTAVETPSTQAAVPTELAQSIETMAHEIASLKQTVEQLQTGQQQLSRDIAKAADHEQRRKLAAQPAKPATPSRPQRVSTPGAPPRPLGTLAPSTPPAYSQREAYIPPPAPPAPTQLPPQPGDTSAPRPPMPLR